MPVKINTRNLLFFAILNTLCPLFRIFKQSCYFFFNSVNGCFLYTQLVPRFNICKVWNVLIIPLEWMVLQLFVFPFLLLSFVPAVNIFSNNDKSYFFKPFYIRKAGNLQKIFITIKLVKTISNDCSEGFRIEG